MPESKKVQISPQVNFWMNFGFAVVVMMIVLLSVTPAFMQIGRMAACPGAADYSLSYESGGTIKRVGSPTTTGTQTVGLSCALADGSTKTVSNDAMFGYGASGSLVISVLAGIILGGWSVWRNRSV